MPETPLRSLGQPLIAPNVRGWQTSSQASRRLRRLALHGFKTSIRIASTIFGLATSLVLLLWYRFAKRLNHQTAGPRWHPQASRCCFSVQWAEECTQGLHFSEWCALQGPDFRVYGIYGPENMVQPPQGLPAVLCFGLTRDGTLGPKPSLEHSFHHGLSFSIYPRIEELAVTSAE